MRFALGLLLALVPALALAQPKSVFIGDLTWREVQEAIASGKTTAIYYAGSTEQNGPHMALGKHNVIAEYLAGRVAQELGNALALPVLPFAPTGDPMKFPGTVNLSDKTFGAVAREVAASMLAAGFRNVVLMGEHGGGQEALKQAAAALDKEWRQKGRRVYYVPDAYYKAQEQIRAYLVKRNLPSGQHAGIEDTSELMYLDRQRQWIRRDKLAPGDAAAGVDGDPRRASPELGKLFLDMKVAAAVAQIRSFVGK
ncbi:MAG TPA: creatininase family protein [Burkholderiales bacterium]|nr:creatininase family protein [Burkholderiales bacterium]